MPQSCFLKREIKLSPNLDMAKGKLLFCLLHLKRLIYSLLKRDCGTPQCSWKCLPVSNLYIFVLLEQHCSWCLPAAAGEIAFLPGTY